MRTSWSTRGMLGYAVLSIALTTGCGYYGSGYGYSYGYPGNYSYGPYWGAYYDGHGYPYWRGRDVPHGYIRPRYDDGPTYHGDIGGSRPLGGF